MHKIVERSEWLEARKALWQQEKELTHQRDRVCHARRELPWVRVEQDYVFQGPQGPVRLKDLFAGRSQLLVYHHMLGEGETICPGCSFLCDHVDAARQHFEHADLSFAAISRAPMERIEQVRKRMGYSFPWVSSWDNSFNYDYGVSFSADQIAAGTAIYNYAEQVKEPGNIHGSSVFALQDGNVYHTYSCFARGNEGLAGAFHYLDLVPKGRNETEGTMSWVRLHDEYSSQSKSGCCHSS